MSENIYFVNREPEKAVSVLLGKTEDFYRDLETTGFMDKLATIYAYYYGAHFENMGDSHTIGFGGDDGELREISINHLANIAQHMINMIVASRPTFKCKASNIDSKSQIQTNLGDTLLQYYMNSREKQLEARLNQVVEDSVVFGSGFLKIGWDAMLGEKINEEAIQEAITHNTYLEEDAPEEDRMVIPDEEFQGDIYFDNPDYLSVVYDIYNQNQVLDWVIVRSFKNRHDLAARYPDMKEEIMNIKTIENGVDRTISFGRASNKEDDNTIPVWEFFHRSTPSVPNGKYMFYADEHTIFENVDLPYREVPVYRMSPKKIRGTQLGWTNVFDLAQPQEAMNALYSTVITNQFAFGVQNVLVPQDANINFQSLGGGLNVLPYDPTEGKPEPLNLTATPPEIFNTIDDMKNAMETISGVSSVVRGSPEASLRSASAIAMVQSNSIQFMSQLQSEYIHLLEDVGTGIINMLIDFADSPRVAQIVGRNDAANVEDFKSEDLREINRVTVEVANPLTKTVAGRLNLFEQVAQYKGDSVSVKELFSIIETGLPDQDMHDGANEDSLIQSENEELMEGREQVIAAVYEDHRRHIERHRSILNYSSRKRDLELVKRVKAHMDEHAEFLTNPKYARDLAITEQVSIQVPQGQPQGDMMPQRTEGEPAIDQTLAGMGGQMQQPGATLPEEFADIPLTAQQNFEEQL